MVRLWSMCSVGARWLIGRVCGHQLAGLMTGMRKLQLQLRQATQAADERTSLLQAKIEELEAQNLSRALEIRQLEQENEGLHRVVEAKAPELARVIRERNDALKELSNAHKFIEDLLSHQEVRAGWLCVVCLLIQRIY